MTPQKIMPIYGTRPEAIKMAPIVRSLQADDRFAATAKHFCGYGLVQAKAALDALQNQP